MISQHSRVVGVSFARAHLPELLQKIEAGDEITITRHGTPIARLVPVNRGQTVADRRDAIERIKKLRDGLALNGLKIADLVREGRR